MIEEKRTRRNTCSGDVKFKQRHQIGNDKRIPGEFQAPSAEKALFVLIGWNIACWLVENNACVLLIGWKYSVLASNWLKKACLFLIRDLMLHEFEMNQSAKQRHNFRQWCENLSKHSMTYQLILTFVFIFFLYWQTSPWVQAAHCWEIHSLWKILNP